MNSVSLIGNLASDVDLRDVAEDKKVASFLLAVNRAGRDSGADFIRIAAWERQAELCAEHLTKGQRVGVDGRLRSHSWDDEGKRRTAVEVVAYRIDFLSAPRPDEPFTDGSQADVIPFEATTR